MSQIYEQEPKRTNTYDNHYSLKEYFLELTIQNSKNPIEMIEFEKLSFQSQKVKLIKDPNLIGKFVAFHNGKLVGSDLDQVTLTTKMYQKFGYVPILIEKLDNEIEFTVHSPQYEIT